MGEITFCKMEHLEHQDEVITMMRSLYEEDQPAHPVDISAFPATFEHLAMRRPAAQIVLIFQEGQLRGYALLIPYWSNEFGGVLLFVDELFVHDGSFNHRIAHRFFDYLGTATSVWCCSVGTRN